MRFLISILRKVINLFGIQFLSLKNYKKLVAYQAAMTQLGVRPSQLDVFINNDPDDDVRIQTERFATYANSSQSYFKKLQKLNFFKAENALSKKANSIQDNHMAQYNEARIAKVLLQEKLTNLEMTTKKKASPAKGKRLTRSLSK